MVERGEVADDFDAFVAAQRGALLRLAYLLTGDRARAEDIVQEALVKTFRHWARVVVAERPEAYVRTMVLNEYLSWRRRRSSHELPHELVDAIAVSDPFGDHAERDAVWSVLAGLPRRQHAVLVLRYYEALPDREIAHHLGCAEGTVRSLAARAFAVLREHPGLRRTQPSPTPPTPYGALQDPRDDDVTRSTP